MIRHLKTFIRAYIWYSLKSLNVTFLSYGQLVTEILHFTNLWDTMSRPECSLGVILVIDNLLYA